MRDLVYHSHADLDDPLIIDDLVRHVLKGRSYLVVLGTVDVSILSCHRFPGVPLNDLFSYFK